MDSKGIDCQHNTTDGLCNEGAITPIDTQNALQDGYDDLLRQLLEEEEEQIPPGNMLRQLLEEEEEEQIPPGNRLDGDTQSEKEDSELGGGDQSEKQKQKCSENIGSSSEMVASGLGDGDQSEKQKQKCSENIGSSSEMVASGEAQRLFLSPSSRSQGVTYNKNNKHWEAHIWIKELVLRGRTKKGVQVFGGNYQTEDEAKQAHDRLAIKFDVRETLRGKPYFLNFPESAQAEFMAEHRDWSLRDFVWLVRRSARKFTWGKSDMKGVTVRASPPRKNLKSSAGEEESSSSSSPPRKKLKSSAGEEESSSSSSGPPVVRYAAKIGMGRGQNKKTANIGTYGSEEEAGKAYDRALLFVSKNKEEVERWHVTTNFRPSDYTDEEIEEAGSKLNFV